MPAKIGRKAKIGRTQRSLLLKSKEKQKAEEIDRLRKACETIRILALREKRKRDLQEQQRLAEAMSKCIPSLAVGRAVTLLRFLSTKKWQVIHESWLDLMEEWLRDEDADTQQWLHKTQQQLPGWSSKMPERKGLTKVHTALEVMAFVAKTTIFSTPSPPKTATSGMPTPRQLVRENESVSNQETSSEESVPDTSDSDSDYISLVQELQEIRRNKRLIRRRAEAWLAEMKHEEALMNKSAIIKFLEQCLGDDDEASSECASGAPDPAAGHARDPRAGAWQQDPGLPQGRRGPAEDSDSKEPVSD